MMDVGNRQRFAASLRSKVISRTPGAGRLLTDSAIHDHLRQAPLWLWEKLWQFNPRGVERFAEGLDFHWQEGRRVEYIRHANIENRTHPTPYARSCDFPRHGGFYILDWAYAWLKTGRADFLDQIRTMLDYNILKKRRRTPQPPCIAIMYPGSLGSRRLRAPSRPCAGCGNTGVSSPPSSSSTPSPWRAEPQARPAARRAATERSGVATCRSRRRTAPIPTVPSSTIPD